MTIDEAFELCKQRYKDGDQVNCIYSGGINTTIYTADMTVLRKLGSWIVCGDRSHNTPYVVLYNGDKNEFAPVYTSFFSPRGTDVDILPKAPHRQEMIDEVVTLAHKLDAYDKIGGIIGSLQKYQKEETLLDQQLRNFKKNTICLE